ncbi:PREDICTED: tetratricopeptide repeat protein 27-like, partial [Cyprinodon variegatus]|uniref:tetratricopeptide repeat protein 27-like n=1 Tax=Cyprinodon variegatus TaxID=28743 RepID=UPI0007428CA7
NKPRSCFICFVSESGSLLQSLLEGDFQAVLLSPQVTGVLSGDGSCKDGEDLEAYLERRLLLYLKGDDDEQQKPNRELTVMAAAVSCLHLFAQSNWTGPPVPSHLCHLLPTALPSSQ